MNILEIPTGAVADALGRRRTMIASFVSYLLSFAIFWTGETLPVFVLAMLLFSFGEAFRSGTHKAMIFTYLRLTGNEQFKADYYGHTRGWSQTGSAVSAAIAAAIVFSSGNYTSVFLFSAIPYVADLALMLTYPKVLDGTRRKFRWSAIGTTFREVFRSLAVTFRKPEAIRVVASASYFGGFYKGTKDYLQPLVAALAVSLPWATGIVAEKREAILIGLIYTLLYSFTAFASRNAGTIADRFKSSETAMNSELLAGLAIGVAIGITSAVSLAVVPVVLFFSVYIIQNMRRPLSVSVVSEAVDEEILATVLSVESQLQSLFAAITVFVIGAIANALPTLIGAGLTAGSSARVTEYATMCVGVGITAVSVLGLLLLPVLWR